jgi:carboxypeptidase Q
MDDRLMQRLPSSRLTLLALVVAGAPLAAQTRVDTAGSGALIAEAMTRSEVMANLEHLSDAIGPRLTGSSAMRRANDWTARRFEGYGLATRLEPYSFGVTWERGPVTLRLLAPFTRAITAHSWAWTAGTHGKPVGGPVVLVDLSTPDSVAAYKDKVRGAWVLPRSSYPLWNPDGPPMTPEDSTQLAERLRLRNQATADTSPPAVLARRQFSLDLP